MRSNFNGIVYFIYSVRKMKCPSTSEMMVVVVVVRVVRVVRVVGVGGRGGGGEDPTTSQFLLLNTALWAPGSSPYPAWFFSAPGPLLLLFLLVEMLLAQIPAELPTNL